MLPLLFSLISSAEAAPTNGFRLGICAGAASNCQFAQLQLSYNTDKLPFSAGVGLLANISTSAQYYVSPVDTDTRQFVSLGYTMVAFPLVVIGFDGSVDGTMGGGVGVAYGADFHLCLLYTSPSPRDATLSRMPSSA